MNLTTTVRYRTFLKNVKMNGVLSGEMPFYHYYTYTFPSMPKIVTATQELGDKLLYNSEFIYKSPDEFDYDNYLYNLTDTLKCPDIERAFSDHLDDVDEDILYHVMQIYRERAVRAQFDGTPSKFWEYDKKVQIPEKLIEVGDFYGTTDRLIFLWNDCWDI